MKKLSISLAVLGMLAAGFVYAQTAQSRFSGATAAVNFAYGYGSITPLSVATGTTATGAGTITLAYGNIMTPDGITYMPLSTTAPIIVGQGANAETVTPSAVSCATPLVYNTCQVTATFSNTHGIGDAVVSATFGLIEAVNYAHTLGGLVAIDGRWTLYGGVTGTITGNKGYTNVCVLDWRGTTTAKSYTSGSNGANMAATAISLY